MPSLLQAHSKRADCKRSFWFGHNWGALDLPDGTFTHVVDQIIHLGKDKVCSVVDASREPGSAEEGSEGGGE